MTPLRATLVSDGSSDRVLVPVIRWLLGLHASPGVGSVDWADPRLSAGRSISERLRTAAESYPCDLLCVHRDAERASLAARQDEIRRALISWSHPAVCVVPVRMQEAWFLFDAMALRTAAGNPGGRMALPLPPARSVERLPDPKRHLHQLLRRASGLRGRHLERFDARLHVHRLAEVVRDYTPLRRLGAFRVCERELRDVLRQNGWLRGTT